MNEQASDDAAADVLEVYVEAANPTAGDRWEILADDVVRYVRPDGTTEQPAVIPAGTLRHSSTWRRTK